MQSHSSPHSIALGRAALALLLATAAAAHAAPASIAVLDEGAQGILLTNLADAPIDPPVTAEVAPPHQAARPKGKAMTRRAAHFAPIVRAAASAHGLPEALLQAVIEVESGFNADAVSPKGALGLMQLMPQTARALRVDDPRDPQRNVEAGARYLKELMARYGNDVSLALAAYNAGPGTVERSGGIPRIRETQSYVPRVMVRYHSIQSGAPD